MEFVWPTHSKLTVPRVEVVERNGRNTGGDSSHGSVWEGDERDGKVVCYGIERERRGERQEANGSGLFACRPLFGSR